MWEQIYNPKHFEVQVGHINIKVRIDKVFLNANKVWTTVIYRQITEDYSNLMDKKGVSKIIAIM